MLLVFSFSAYTRQPHPMLPMLPMLPVLPVLLLLLLSMACNHRHRCCCWCCFCCWRKPHPHSVVVGSESAPVCHSRQRATGNLQPAHGKTTCRMPHLLHLAACWLLICIPSQRLSVCLRLQIVGGDCLFCSPAALEPGHNHSAAQQRLGLRKCGQRCRSF